MKKLIGVVVLAFLSVTSYAQEINQRNVPAVVLNAFQVKFPNAYDIEWRLEKGYYQVDFEVNNKDNKLVMSDKGILLSHNKDLYVSEIPAVVLATIQSEVPFYDVYDADRLEEGGRIIYKVNFEISGKDHDFEIEDNGQILKYTKELKDSEVPAPIANMINSKYSELDIDYAKYHEENEKISYYIKGEINDKDNDFWFDENASLIKHNQDLRNSEIPVSIQNTIKARYEGFEIRDADLIEEDGKTIYDLELRNSKNKVHLILNPKGEILEIK